MPAGGLPPRFVAWVRNATAWPSPLNDGAEEAALPRLPPPPMLRPLQQLNAAGWRPPATGATAVARITCGFGVSKISRSVVTNATCMQGTLNVLLRHRPSGPGTTVISASDAEAVPGRAQLLAGHE